MTNVETLVIKSLNAPYGARCFLTYLGHTPTEREARHVLMHLMALGAF